MSCVRDAEAWLPKYLEQLDNLDYPEDRLRFSFVEGGSVDRSRGILLDWLKTKKDTYFRQIDINATPAMPPRRRMWLSGNYSRKLFRDVGKTLEGEPAEYLFICDCDVSYLPPETLRVLIPLDVDVVAPYVFVDPEPHPDNPYRGGGIFFDTWAFRFLRGPHPGLVFNSTIPKLYARNMERDPSIGADLEKKIIPMESVGACPVLIKGQVARNVWYTGDKAIVGFCEEAREAGYKIWSYPGLESLHTWRGRINES